MSDFVPYIETVGLTKKQQKRIDDIWKTIDGNCHVDKYGGSTADAACCKKLKTNCWNSDYEFEQINGSALRPHVVAYLQKYKVVRKRRYYEGLVRITLSHICGEHLCIEATHICYEPFWWNQNRKICHNLLWEWVSSQRRNKEIDVTGTMTIARMQMQQRKLGIKVQCWRCYHDWLGDSKCIINVGVESKTKNAASRKRQRNDVFSMTCWTKTRPRRSKRIQKR